MSDIYMLVGIPASGKSTWAAENMIDDMVWVSRDEIRNQLVGLDKGHEKEYFSKETLVYDTFIDHITAALLAGKDVIADATHIDSKARSKLMRMVRARGVQFDNLIAVVFNLKKDIALERNSKRKGWRRVPDRVIHEMYEKFIAGLRTLPREGVNMIIDGLSGEVVYND